MNSASAIPAAFAPAASPKVFMLEHSTPAMVVASFFHAPSGTWSYIVSDPTSRRAAVIDGVLDFDAKSARTSTIFLDHLIGYLRQHELNLAWILETHAHADHFSAADVLKRAMGGTTAAGAGVVNVQAVFRKIYHLGDEFPIDGSQFDRLLRDDDEITVGALTGHVMGTAGHTNDSVSYHFGDSVFVGDTVFMPEMGTARCDFPGGDAATLYRSIQRLYALPEDTHLYVGHDYPAASKAPRCEASVADHKRSNVHLCALTAESDFVSFRRARDATLELPALLIPAVQVNIRAGRMPEQESNGTAYLKIPLNVLGRKAAD